MESDVRQEAAEVAEAGGMEDRRSLVPRRDDDLSAGLRVAVLEDQLAIVISQRQDLVRELGLVTRRSSESEELVESIGRNVGELRLAMVQMAGLFTVLSDVVADQVGADVKGALYVAGEAARGIVAAVV